MCSVYIIWPALDAGKIYFTGGPIMAIVDNWEIELT